MYDQSSAISLDFEAVINSLRAWFTWNLGRFLDMKPVNTKNEHNKCRNHLLHA